MAENQYRESINNFKNQSTFKRWFGFGMMIFCCIVSILCVFPSFLHIGFFFYRLFGVNVWVLLVLCALTGFALFKGLNFTASKKYVFFIVASYLSVLCLIHLIVSTNVLSSYYLDFSHMKSYLSSVYYLDHGVSVGGAVLSIFVYIIRSLLGVVGSYVVYVISSAIFIGLSIDYIIYNKAMNRRKVSYSEKSKKLMEEKLLSNSKIIDSRDDVGTMPTYSFGGGSGSYNPSAYTPNESDNSWNNSNIWDETNPSSFDDVDTTMSDNKTGSFDFNEERENARRKLFDDYPSADTTPQINNDNEPLTAREKLFGKEPKLPDYLYTNKSAEEETRNYVNSFGNAFGANFGSSNNFSSFEDPSPTKTPNLDENILNRTSVKSSWNNFQPEETSSFDSMYHDVSESNNIFADSSSEVSKFGFDTNFGTNVGGDVSFSPKEQANDGFSNGFSSGGFEAKGLGALIPEQKVEPAKPQRKVTKQTNIYDDAPKKYFAPPISLLKVYKDDNRDHSQEHQRKSAILNQVFESFKIPAQVSNVVRGPKFTRYEITLQIGVPVSKILQIEKNLEMALETDAGIRIEAPIPGKNAVGIEVKNDVSTTVGLRELLEAPEYINSKHNLPVAIGKNITGNIVVSSMDKMLHALVAGTTGSGKSVFIHSLILRFEISYGINFWRIVHASSKEK